MQYFGHVLRVVQKLLYLYGWQDLGLNSNEINDETKNMLTLFVGIMFGINGATKVVNNLSFRVVTQVAKKLPQKALTKGTIYQIVKNCSYVRVKND